MVIEVGAPIRTKEWSDVDWQSLKIAQPDTTENRKDKHSD